MGMEHNHAVDKDGNDPGKEDVEDGEMLGEDDSGHVEVNLVSVSLEGDQNQGEGCLLPEGASHDCLELANDLSVRPAFCQGGINSPKGD